MEQNLKTAIEQMKQNDESGLNYIYAKTYNYVYLRAKNILKRESDVLQLMQEVYLKMLASSEEIKEDNLYEWIGKCVYTLGCQWYRKKKTREIFTLEIEKHEFEARKSTDLEKAVNIIEKSLEELPDLYQATFYAFYYDYMSVEEIAKVMDCTEGTIINRLNYTRKYMMKALENYQTENNVKVAFSVEAVCMALRQWSVEHCLGITVAHKVYAEICKSADLQPESIYLEGKEFAGVNNTVVYRKADDYTMFREQFEKYGRKSGIDKKKLGLIIGVAAIVIIVIVAIASSVNSDKKDSKVNDVQVQNEEQQKSQTTEEKTDEDNAGDEAEEKSEDEKKDEAGDASEEISDSEYIIPDSDTRELTWGELESYTKEELRLARNEIFARHGMIFNIEDLDNYFATKSWYVPTVSYTNFYDEVEMNAVEESNIRLIKEVEDSK